MSISTSFEESEEKSSGGSVGGAFGGLAGGASGKRPRKGWSPGLCQGFRLCLYLDTELLSEPV